MDYYYLTIEYTDENDGRCFWFLFSKVFSGYVDVRKFTKGRTTYTAHLHRIKCGQIVLRSDDFLSEGAREFINKALKLMVFA